MSVFSRQNSCIETINCKSMHACGMFQPQESFSEFESNCTCTTRNLTDFGVRVSWCDYKVRIEYKKHELRNSNANQQVSYNDNRSICYGEAYSEELNIETKEFVASELCGLETGPVSTVVEKHNQIYRRQNSLNMVHNDMNNNYFRKQDSDGNYSYISVDSSGNTPIWRPYLDNDLPGKMMGGERSCFHRVMRDKIDSMEFSEGNYLIDQQYKKKKICCPYCDVTCFNNGQLAGHIRVHTGERPYSCDFQNCGKAFARNEELTRHRRIHTGDRPHQCAICRKRFGRKDHLSKHEKTHLKASDKQTHKCLISGCGNRYTRSDALSRHQWTSHGIKAKLPAGKMAR